MVNQQSLETIDPKQGTPEPKFIIFSNIRANQGVGNIMSGLLAVHMLGIEFNRIVCVDPGYEEFLQAFEPIDAEAVRKCPQLLHGLDVKAMESTSSYIQLVNFGRPPDECKLRKRLESQDTLLIQGNTYPRWAEVPEDISFFRYYRAKSELLSILPYSEPPRTVAHLRAPDGLQDIREGVTEKSLRRLFTELIPNDIIQSNNQQHDNIFAVCNRVHWYNLFDELGVRHATWEQVSHSAFHRSWGTRSEDTHLEVGVIRLEQMDEGAKFNKTNNLQMWADWFTILTAKQVYHTHSDFSSSAIHWQGIPSRRILGDGTQLHFEREIWEIDQTMPRLVDRRHPPSSENDNFPERLANCFAYPDQDDRPMMAIAVEEEPPPEVGKLRFVGVKVHHRNQSTIT